MRIFAASIIQETNTFCPYPTDLSLFHRGYYLKGQAVVDRLHDTNTEMAGFCQFLMEEPGVEFVPGLAAWAVASGKVTASAYTTLADDLLAGLEACRPAAGILLAFHGAWVSQTSDDCEGDLLETIRRRTGPEIPIVCTLDYHAVVTAKMVEQATLLIGYRTYPHVDCRQTGERAAKALVQLIRAQERPAIVFETLPMIVPVENTETADGPIVRIMDELKVMDKDLAVRGASFFCPHPWLDIPIRHPAILIYGSDSTLRQRARELLEDLWDRRAEFFTQFPTIDAFLARPLPAARPVVLVDSGDITSAGGTGDSTEILRCVLRHNAGPKIVLTVVDPEAVVRAFAVGEGQTASFQVGGAVDAGYNRRVPLNARVKKLDEAPVTVRGPAFAGLPLHMGRRALLEIDGTIHLILSEFTSLVHDPEVLRSLGLDPRAFDLIVQKSHKLFRPAYRDIARSIVPLDTPGFTDRNIRRLGFKRVKRPIYPLDEIQRVPYEQV